jgi:galactose mutarotase-like enzyme
MFTITKQPQAESVYVLSDTESQSSLTVFPDRGGIATSWKVNDRELMYLDAERFTDRTLSVRGGFPILFPICGNLPDNTYNVGVREYSLKQHGFARELPWSVSSQSTDRDASLTITLESNAATLAVYPFDFTVSFTYRIRGGELVIDQTYANHSVIPMPFSTGLHPYFQAPAKNSLIVEIPSPSYQEKQTGETHPFTGKFDFSQAEIDAAFTNLTGNTTIVSDPHQKLTLTMTQGAEYRNIVFWTVQDKDFYCLEPWTGPRNSLNTGRDLLYVAPGETLTAQVIFHAKFHS